MIQAIHVHTPFGLTCILSARKRTVRYGERGEDNKWPWILLCSYLSVEERIGMVSIWTPTFVYHWCL